ncbi:hypothetical protein KIW84_040343 [Lathyrus oleraceus]|uniref:Uncharacterized protein n=1 Tax=Pisum sativum TaxID=3888 RepID=A0A9D4X527_PEA|nr:hypothetical protein KIW84_040343 [Pisum sativum]
MNKLSIADEQNVGVNMVEVSQRNQAEVDEDLRRKKDQRLAYPKEEENLVEFIKRCQKMRTEVMLCPRCSEIFDRKAATNLEIEDKAKRKENWGTTGYDPRKRRRVGNRFQTVSWGRWRAINALGEAKNSRTWDSGKGISYL